jgi:hypothetical protein
MELNGLNKGGYQKHEPTTLRFSGRFSSFITTVLQNVKDPNYGIYIAMVLKLL